MAEKQSSALPEVSIIIRTYNEQKYLPLLLDALEQQTDRNFETILVDSGSVDDTCRIAEGRVDQLIRIEQHDFTFGYALNIGGKAAKGKFLVMVSAHTRPCHPDWLTQLVAPLRQDNVAMSYGRQVGWKSSKFGEAADFYRVFHTRREKLVPPHFFANNANSAVRRDLWEQHPFDEKLPGLEDAEFARHWMDQGYDVIYEPDAVLNHIHEETWPQVHRRYFREAVAARVMGMHDASHVPEVWLRETWWLFKDLWRLAFDKPAELGQKSLQLWFKEILKFRWLKATGTVQGLKSDETIDDQDARDTYYFDRASVALEIQAPGKTQFVSRSIHEPKPGEVILRVAYVLAEKADQALFAGQSVGLVASRRMQGPQYPIVPGRHFSATIVAAGQNVRHVNPGDLVVTEAVQSCGRCGHCKKGDLLSCDRVVEAGFQQDLGGYADYVTVAGRFVHKMPSDLSAKTATLTGVLAGCFKMLRRYEAWAGSRSDAPDRLSEPVTVRIIGKGIKAQVMAMVLKHCGYRPVYDADKTSKTVEIATVVMVTDLDANLAGSMAQSLPFGAVIVVDDSIHGYGGLAMDSLAIHENVVIGAAVPAKQDYEKAVSFIGSLDIEAFHDRTVALEDAEALWSDMTRQGETDILNFVQVAER